MSDKDKPANPFGRVERTIIRPNPGGRLPQPPGPQSLSGEAGRATSRAAYSPTPVSTSPASGYSPQAAGYVPSPLSQPPGYVTSPTTQSQGAAFALPPTTHQQEDWVSASKAAPQHPPLMTPAEPMLRVDELVAPNANPIMRAAGPLLQLLGRLRVADARIFCTADGAGRRRREIL